MAQATVRFEPNPGQEEKSVEALKRCLPELKIDQFTHVRALRMDEAKAWTAYYALCNHGKCSIVVEGAAAEKRVDDVKDAAKRVEDAFKELDNRLSMERNKATVALLDAVAGFIRRL